LDSTPRSALPWSRPADIYVVSDLLHETTGLDILVTSRTLLRLDGEQVFSVPPLPLPSRTQVSTPDSAARWPAVQLFVLRAQAVQPSLEVTADNFESILGICRELDGLPLALELAAARVNVLPDGARVGRSDGGSARALNTTVRCGGPLREVA
jgi:predicted ATPase